MAVRLALSFRVYVVRQFISGRTREDNEITALYAVVWKWKLLVMKAMTQRS